MTNKNQKKFIQPYPRKGAFYIYLALAAIIQLIVILIICIDIDPLFTQITVPYLEVLTLWILKIILLPPLSTLKIPSNNNKWWENQYINLRKYFITLEAKSKRNCLIYAIESHLKDSEIQSILEKKQKPKNLNSQYLGITSNGFHFNSNRYENKDKLNFEYITNDPSSSIYKLFKNINNNKITIIFQYTKSLHSKEQIYESYLMESLEYQTPQLTNYIDTKKRIELSAPFGTNKINTFSIKNGKVKKLGNYME